MESKFLQYKDNIVSMGKEIWKTKKEASSELMKQKQQTNYSRALEYLISNLVDAYGSLAAVESCLEDIEKDDWKFYR